MNQTNESVYKENRKEPTKKKEKESAINETHLPFHSIEKREYISEKHEIEMVKCTFPFPFPWFSMPFLFNSLHFVSVSTDVHHDFRLVI